MIATALTSNEARYSKGTQQITLLPQNEIPESTLLLTGTGAGVLFKPANIWRQGFYLQVGDTVRTEATFLGHLSNQVVSP
jgi:fumarylacetoacetate (FAA) hydrolase family protein